MLRRRAVAGLLIGALAGALLPGTAAAVDPFVLFLLRMLRDQAVSSAIESGAAAARIPRKPDPAFAPGALIAPPANEAERLRRLIDESFVHLRPEQRQELHASLLKILDDPDHAARRGEILAAFTARAEATRQAHRQLSRLSEEEMRAVAEGARDEFAKLPLDQRREMLQALEQGVPGMPGTLHDLMLAEFRSVASR